MNVTTFLRCRHLRASSCAVAAVMLAAGCDAPRSEPVGTATQALGGYWLQGAGLAQPTFTVQVQDATQWTCFLSGVSGVITDGDPSLTLIQPRGVSLDIANCPLNSTSASVAAASSGAIGAGSPPCANTSGGGGAGCGSCYFMEAGNEKSLALTGQTLCIPTTANRTEPVAWGGGAKKVLAPVTASRQCGLVAVYDPFVSPTIFDSSWMTSTDNVQITHDDVNWYIGGTGHAGGAGACVDVTATTGNLEWVAPNPGTATDPLDTASSVGAGGQQCFLTGLGGSFRNSDWNDGVTLAYESLNSRWTTTVSNGKTAWYACVE